MKFQVFSHHGSHSNSGKHHHNHNYESNSNHHYNEQNTLGISNGGAKSSNFIHIDTIEITNKDISNNRFKLNVCFSYDFLKKCARKLIFPNFR